MAENQVRQILTDRLSQRLVRLGLSSADLTDDLDLIRSGVLDSLGFVDLIADLENATGKQVDLERALEHRNATTVANVISLFADA
ncbi:MAG: acyl carrier protein [Flavobacteriales bacterium]|nr:acyl carrier protein [Flavobacteriales bacterium]